jgi:hypothetical protein
LVHSTTATTNRQTSSTHHDYNTRTIVERLNIPSAGVDTVEQNIRRRNKHGRRKSKMRYPLLYAHGKAKTLTITPDSAVATDAIRDNTKETPT